MKFGVARNDVGPADRASAGVGMLLLMGLLTAPGPAAAQEAGTEARAATTSPDSTGSVVGYVRDDSTGVPIAAAEVSLPELGRRTLTGIDGGFSFESVPAGTYLLRLKHIRYGTREAEVSVEAGQQMGVELAFSPRAIELEPVTVSVRAMNPDLTGTGFYHRMLSGEGGFFGGEDYVNAPARSYQPVREALMQNWAVRAVFVNMVGPGRCMGPIFLNGRPFDPGYVTDYFRDLAGIEVYSPSEVPPDLLEELEAYRRATKGLPRHPAAGDADDIHRLREGINRCGVILLWADRDGEVFGED